MALATALATRISPARPACGIVALQWKTRIVCFCRWMVDATFTGAWTLPPPGITAHLGIPNSELVEKPKRRLLTRCSESAPLIGSDLLSRDRLPVPAEGAVGP